MKDLIAKAAPLDVVLANTAAIGVTLSGIQDILSVVSLTLAIGYSAWRWADDIQKRNKRENGNR